MTMINFGVIGFGYWGPNIVRNLTFLRGASVKVICDGNTSALKQSRMLYPHVHASRDNNDILKSKNIDAVAIVTPVSTHYELAKKALEGGKHIFVEKPFVETVGQAERLIALAQKKKLQIMVDHVFNFTGAVRKIKEVMERNTLGDLYYYDSFRASLGLFRNDVNVIWDLAPHDFSIIDYVIKSKPVAITAHGVDHFKRGHENIAYITVYFENRFIAHINVNWLSPVKIRTTLIGGRKKMLLWDDQEADEKIKIYDKGVKVSNKKGIYRLMVDYRSGNAWSPRIDRTEALKTELEYFLRCIAKNTTPINDGKAGLRVMKLLLATDESLKKRGKMIKL